MTRIKFYESHHVSLNPDKASPKPPKASSVAKVPKPMKVILNTSPDVPHIKADAAAERTMKKLINSAEGKTVYPHEGRNHGKYDNLSEVRDSPEAAQIRAVRKAQRDAEARAQQPVTTLHSERSGRIRSGWNSCPRRLSFSARLPLSADGKRSSRNGRPRP